MIQLKRGKTQLWREDKNILASGQPGYDKEKHKIKIGDGEKSWQELPYASGLFEEDILYPETLAKIRNSLDSEDKTLFTYGTEAPDVKTVGQVYLQYYDAEPEIDYIVEAGRNGIWTYQKWNSGIAKCSGAVSLNANVQNAFEGVSLFYDNNVMNQIDYPFTFSEVPSESATVQSSGGLAWLASRVENTEKASGAYSIISSDSLASVPFRISLKVEGLWK